MNAETSIINRGNGPKNSRSKHRRKSSSKQSKQKLNSIINLETNTFCRNNTEESIFDPQIDDKENISNFNISDFHFSVKGKTNRSSKNSSSTENEVYYCSKGSFKPRVLKYSMQITKVNCGESHVGFITSGGHLYMMGSNEKGKLGIGDITLNIDSNQSVPSLVEDLINYEIVDVSCGRNHTIALSKEGIVFGWGEGQFGSLGVDSRENTCVPIIVQYFCDYGRLNYFAYMNNLIKILYQLKIKKISAGCYHTGFVSENGDVFICGSRDYISDNIRFIHLPEKANDICCGDNKMLILTQSGFVHCIDFNDIEAEGISITPRKITELENEFIVKISCNKYYSAVSEEGALYVWGDSVLGKFDKPKRITCIPKSVSDISLGSNVSGCIDSSGLIWVWGLNCGGELGVGDCKEKLTPFPVMALKSK